MRVGQGSRWQPKQNLMVINPVGHKTGYGVGVAT